MKLVLAIVHGRDKGKTSDRLLEAGFKFTIIGSTGGFLREGNTTFLIGVEDEQVEPLQNLIRETCRQREQVVNLAPMDATHQTLMSSSFKAPVGGGVLFVLDVERFEGF